MEIRDAGGLRVRDGNIMDLLEERLRERRVANPGLPFDFNAKTRRVFRLRDEGGLRGGRAAPSRDPGRRVDLRGPARRGRPRGGSHVRRGLPPRRRGDPRGRPDLGRGERGAAAAADGPGRTGARRGRARLGAVDRGAPGARRRGLRAGRRGVPRSVAARRELRDLPDHQAAGAVPRGRRRVLPPTAPGESSPVLGAAAGGRRDRVLLLAGTLPAHRRAAARGEQAHQGHRGARHRPGSATRGSPATCNGIRKAAPRT